MKGASVVKGLFGAIFLMLVGMLYWSSLLQEKDLKTVRHDMKELRTEVASLGQRLSRELHTLQNAAVVAQKQSSPTSSSYPSLLEEDPYLTTTLPQLLGENFHPHGILKRALIGKPDSLHPFNNFRDVSEMIGMCTPQVANLKTGCYETMAPEMALRFEARPCFENPQNHEYWIFLRDDVFWEPLNADHFPETLELDPHFFKKHPVTAHDFKFFYDAIMNPYMHEGKAASLRTYFSDIEKFTVINDTTFVVRWKAFPTHTAEGEEVHRVKYTSLSLTGALQPLPRFVYQYFADGQKIIEEDDDPDTYRKNSVWAQNFSHHWAKNVIVSCGPYLFDGMSEEGISFKRNPNFYDPYAVLIDGVKFTFKESLDAVWQDFKAGKIDLCTLSSNQLIELNDFLKSEEYQVQQHNHQAIERLNYVDLSYYYIGWSQLKPFFRDENVRKAMTLAIDRRRIIEQNLNMMAVDITGPFFRYSPSYDAEVPSYPYNPEEARRLLEEAGWSDIDGDGIRDKIIEGEKVPFRFKLHYFVKSLSTKVIAEYIMTALREVGIQCELSGLDIADLSRQFEDKNFDAIFMGWRHGTPPEDPRQLWHSAGAKEKGSSNAIGFVNQEIDKLIELLSYEYDKSKRVTFYHQFHKIIHEQAPYTFLYTPKVVLLYREYVHNLFIPREKQDLIPGANIPEPNLQVIWLAK
jgi:peptide/nickel transport system substrate-binding protein